MFDTISNEYDGLNRIISFGIDIKWRNKVVQLVAGGYRRRSSFDSCCITANASGEGP